MFILVKTRPNSKKEKVIEKGEHRYEVYVKEKAEGGRANDALKHVLASYFKVPLKSVVLKRGARARNKIFEISEVRRH